MPAFLQLGFGLKLMGAVIVSVAALATLLGWLGRRNEQKAGANGGTGQVVGIVGRMGSGKTMLAVKIAWDRLRAGGNVCTNFTMHLPEQYRDQWTLFTGWDQLADLQDATVILDEAHLYAPSNLTLRFPTVARWKLSMGRKFKLDLYWISQHENRVNTVLRDLTGMIYVCSAWMGGSYFQAKGYEPEYLRKEGKHVDAKRYKFDPRVAALYDTLQIIDADEHLYSDGKGKVDQGMVAMRERGRTYNEQLAAKRRASLGGAG